MKEVVVFVLAVLLLCGGSFPSFSVESVDVDIIIGSGTDEICEGLSVEDTPGIVIETPSQKVVSTRDEVIKSEKKIKTKQRVLKEKITKSKVEDKNTEKKGYLRPVAIMVENEPPARPQSGLYGAKYVFEIVAEEITRFMPIFYKYPKDFEVGPVRSARDYFADISTMFDCPYVHCGGSPKGLQFIKEHHLDDIDAIRGARGFYRTRDRKIPHNLYTKLDRIKKEIKRKKYREYTDKVIPFTFADEGRTYEVECDRVVIPYYRRYKVEYRYIKKLNKYRRYYRGKPFRAKKTGVYHDIDNIIIQRIKTKMVDSAMRHEMNLYSGGTAEILIGGRLIVGRWSRDKSGNFVYLDGEFNEVKFNPGKIWINFVEPKLKVKFYKPTNGKKSVDKEK